MIEIGTKVSFDPFEGIKGEGCADLKRTVCGTVTFVNKCHRWFLAEYEDGRKCFKFSDIGETVLIVEGK